MADESFKKCPFCAEFIDESSEICPYCKTNLAEPSEEKNSDKQILITTSIVLSVVYLTFLCCWVYAFLFHPHFAKELGNVTQKQKFDNMSALLSLGFFVSVPVFVSICFDYKKQIVYLLIAINMISAILVSIFTFLR